MFKQTDRCVAVRARWRRSRRASRLGARDHRAGPRQGERRHPHQDRVRAAAGRRAAAAGPSSANVIADEPRAAEGDREVTPHLILEAVDELLLIQRGRELGFALGDEQFNSILDNIKKQNNLEDEAQFQAALKQEGMTMADLRRNLERQMLASEVQRREVVDKISVTEDEAQAYYEAHKQEFTTPSEITLREILIEVPDDRARRQRRAGRRGEGRGGRASASGCWPASRFRGWRPRRRTRRRRPTAA